MRRRLSLGGLGALLALLPALTPMLALALVRGPSPRRFRLLAAWLAAALLLGVPMLARGENPVFFWSGLFGLAAAIGGWSLGARRLDPRLGRALGNGAVIGLGMTAAATIVQIILGDLRPTGWPWVPHANDLGHQTLVLSVAAMILARRPARRWWTWAVGMLITVACGSRAAMAGMVLLGLWLASNARNRRRVWAGLALGAALILTVLTLLPTGRRALPAATQALRVISGRAPSAFPSNLLLDGDDLRAPPWIASGVRVEPSSERATGDEPSVSAAWSVRKVAPGPQAGIRQRVTLRPDTSYVFSVELRPTSNHQLPGMVAVHGPAAERWFMVVADRTGLRAESREGVEVRDATILPLEGGWLRLVVRFDVTADEPGSAYIGPVVDARAGGDGGALLELRRPQLTPGTELEPYSLVRSEDWLIGASANALLARWGYWLVGWRGFEDHPWLGSSLDGFAQRYQDWLAPSERGNTVPTHPHNLVLGVAYASGLPGLAGLAVLLLLLYLGLASGPNASLPLAAFWIVLGMNLVDFTFFYGGVLYPLAALAGWQAGQAATSGSYTDNSP